jgi:hypothetical protein
MVRAILAGTKTQTRRVVKPQPPEWIWITSMGLTAFTPPGHFSGRGYWKGVPGDEGPGEKFFRMPYGQPGDRLWVREGWCGGVAALPTGEGLVPSLWIDRTKMNRIVYRATSDYGSDQPPWRPSIHMPRWASRITLELTDVRVQRVQDIREDDAKAEGVDPLLVPPDGGSAPHVEGFRDLWDRINAKRGFGWSANPWCWCLSFKVVNP